MISDINLSDEGGGRSHLYTGYYYGAYCFNTWSCGWFNWSLFQLPKS